MLWDKKMTEIQVFLEHKAYQLRRLSIIMSATAQSGHPTSCLSAADIVAVLFFYVMRFDPDNFNNPDNDRFILSKGHASALLYAAWNQLGKISDEELLTYRQYGSVLEGHPTRRCQYVQAATGSLGIGLSIGLGHALNARMEARDYYTYVLLGDAELAEGSIWEAAELASYYKLNNIIGIVDCNRLGQTGQTMIGAHAQRYAQRFEAFGWKTYIVDGHDIGALMRLFDDVRSADCLQPHMVIANTKKGHGVTSVEDKNGYHGKFLDTDALDELAYSFSPVITYTGTYTYTPRMPHPRAKKTSQIQYDITSPVYRRDDLVATRKAYGQALAALGKTFQEIVVLDADVKNSTYSELFEKAHPGRFIECFVAEQNMVSMGVGFDQCEKVPFISTFGSFMTRAHDQIRMAAIGQSAIKLVGSHVGVSIGHDGPSQMALEDIAMMRAVPDSIVLYPCDAVSTTKLVEQMIGYRDGISYLRTTRAETPVLYDADAQFPIGGCKILRQSDNDVACIVAAGITVFEALKAYDQLQKQNIFVSVIDLYSIKPFNVAQVSAVVNASQNRVITVEDHYIQGGIGEMVANGLINMGSSVTSLAIKHLPKSGACADLMSAYGIDAAHVVQAILQRIKEY